MECIERHASFGGFQEVWEHASETVCCAMRFGVFLPPAARERACPVLYFLSGLTCTEQNVITKGGFQRAAAQAGLIVVTPDTSPRGEGIPDDPGWDLGQGAGFYLNATRAPWSAHYHMADYVMAELPALIDARFPSNGRRSISGHSMGGHGALVLALRHPGAFRSVSAFAPIVAPSAVPWGHKAFGAYLGHDQQSWSTWDACALIASELTERLPLLVDQGLADGFLEEQLQPHRLAAACDAAGHPLTLRLQPGYDHSYYFIAHHARALEA